MSDQNAPLVRIVDDDPTLRKSLAFLLSCEGYETVGYESARDFLVKDSPSQPGCIILDVKMPEVSGIALQKELNRRANTLPIIFLTAHGDIDMAVQSLHDGAFDFQQKPIDPPRLITSISRAIKKSTLQHGMRFDVTESIAKYQRLTKRENEVLRFVSQGFLNREIAQRLNVSVRTVETQRASGKWKLQIDSVSELSLFFQNIDSLLKDGQPKLG